MDGTDPIVAFRTPQRDAELIDWIRLFRSRRVGPSTFFRLLAEHGSAEVALAHLPEVARSAGVDSYEACPDAVAVAELKAGRLAGAEPLPFGAPDYPPLLCEIPDPPPLLWALGDRSLLGRSAIGLVGARSASSLGLRLTRKLAVDLGRMGHVIVSGMARGIDAAAHEAALETGTVAVLAGGVDVVYPKENAVLAQEIQDRGLRLSEQPPGTLPQARHFAQRNRLISGLARALVVVEAAAKSGSLITARAAADQGRDVMAVPGHPFDARASGCNMLIRDGALLVRSASDIAEALDAPAETARPAAPQLDVPAPDAPADAARIHQLHNQILGIVSPAPRTEDQVIRDLSLPASVVSPAIVALEIEGKLTRRPGGVICRT